MINITFKNIFLSLFFCILFSSIINSSDYTCLERSVCLCKLDDNKYIDLSKINVTDALIDTYHDLTYFLYPCKDVNFDATKYNLVVNATLQNDCAKGTSLCLYNQTEQSLTNLGLASEGILMNDFPKTWRFSHGNRDTLIHLVCSPQYDGTKLGYRNNTSNYHELDLFSEYACMLTSHPGLSIGSTLLILFATIFGVYLIGGVLILHFLRGARGTEMIPNLDFWGTLPGLVKDGTIFLLGGCNPMVITSADTYDRI